MTAIADNSLLLTMPFIENNDSIAFGDFVKSEICLQQKPHHHQQYQTHHPQSHQHHHHLSLSSPQEQALASFEQPTSFCALEQPEAIFEPSEDARSDTRTSTPHLKTEELKTDDLPCLDPDSSAESSPMNFPGDLDFLPPQLTYYTYNEEDSGSETSYGTQHSPVLPSADYNTFALAPDNFQQWSTNYYDMLNATQNTASFQQGNGVQSADQMRFIIYEPESTGAGLVPTLSNNNTTVQNMWSSAATLAAANDPNASRGGVMATTAPMPYFTPQQQSQPTSLDAAAAAAAAVVPAKTGQVSGQQSQPQTIRCPHEDCPKTFSRLYNLKAHLRSHSPARPYPCPMCPRSFSRKHDLQRHIRVHTGVKPYQCPCCNKAFARTDALRRHFKMEETCRNSPEVQNMKTRRRYSEMH
jgi:hypothetical protein